MRDWSMVKLLPSETGLPMAVWIIENEEYPHKTPQIRVSLLHGEGGSWRDDAVTVAIHPRLQTIPSGKLPPADLRLLSRWVQRNYLTIVDFWNGHLSLAPLLARLRKESFSGWVALLGGAVAAAG
jgi:hypothetical protein